MPLNYYTAYGLSIGSEIPLHPLIEKAPGSIDVLIRRDKVSVGDAERVTKIYRAGLQARFAQNNLHQLWLNWCPLMSFMALNGTELVIDTDQTNKDLVALFTLSEAIGLILFQRGYFLLHGSAIRLNSSGIVFLGEPGAGKSTTVAAFAQNNVPVLSDDMVCIRIDESGKPFLIPAFPQIKIWQNTVDGLHLTKHKLISTREGAAKYSWHDPNHFAEEAVPVNRLFILNPPVSSVSPVTHVAKHEIPIALLRYFPLPDLLLEGEILKDYFEKSIVLAHTMPVFTMNRPADFTSLYTFVDWLKAEIGHED